MSAQTYHCDQCGQDLPGTYIDDKGQRRFTRHQLPDAPRGVVCKGSTRLAMTDAETQEYADAFADWCRRIGQHLQEKNRERSPIP